MEIIEVKKKAILLDADEIEKVRRLVNRGAMNLQVNEDDLVKFAEYFDSKLSEL